MYNRRVAPQTGTDKRAREIMTKPKGKNTDSNARQTFCSTALVGRLKHAVRSAADETGEQVRSHLRVLPSPTGREVSQSREADDELRELIRSVQKRRVVSHPPDELPPAA